MSAVIGGPSGKRLVSQPDPNWKAPMTTALPSYTTSGDTTLGATLGDSEALRALGSFTRTGRFFWPIVAIRKKHRRGRNG